MNVTILTYVDNEDSGTSTCDAVVPQVETALRALGHTPSILPAHGDAARLLRELEAQSPALIFNLMEMFGENVLGDVGVAGLLELLGVPFTGGGAGELHLAQDKALGKKLLAYAGIAYPRFAVFGRDAGIETGGNLRMPLFVKPLRMDASIGIDAHGLVHDARSLLERVAYIHDECHDSALAEEFIPGREFYVGVLGNRDPVALPPIEMDFSGLPEGFPHVLGGKAKWDQESVEYKGTRAVLAELPVETRAKLSRIAIEAYRTLQVRDYGRVDLRMTDAGDIYVLEVNANCYLERSGELAVAAGAVGLDYTALIETIAKHALVRFEDAPRPIFARRSRSMLPPAAFAPRA